MAKSMNHLTLQTDLGIERVADLHAALQPHLEDDVPLQLAGDRVERVHAAGLQLLHAFVRDRAARGQSTTITQASPALAAAARQLALAVSLGVDGTEPERSDMHPTATTLPATGATA
ncbi:STAS domain-containing protein [Luteimonas viscosa]|uniref:STAS domain-containing protein n=1 Tax=Luteimonas viscosa TaxID=1132694 RepID=UPI0016548469|nr:STAS domain-containing protein [Luteimonas viscosa]